MKIALLNYSGNVGKTTLARDLLKPRLPNYEMVNVESTNDDGKEDLIIRGEEGDKLYAELLLNDNLILDIGASNLQAFFISGQKEIEIINNIDVFILPVTPEVKQQLDTGKTIKSLLTAGVEASKIHVLPNKVVFDPNSSSSISDTFAELRKITTHFNINFEMDCVIEQHDLYKSGKTLNEMLSKEDYRAQMEVAKAKGDKENARKLANKYVRQKRLQKLNEHYQYIFDNLIGKNYEY